MIQKETVNQNTVESYKLFKIKGNSMFPLLKNNDTIRIKPLKEEPKVGNCYVFQYHSDLYIHRLLRRENNQYTFLGDNTDNYHTVPRESIKGVPCISENKTIRWIINIINKYFIKKRNSFFNTYLRIKIIHIIFLLFNGGSYEKKI